MLKRLTLSLRAGLFMLTAVDLVSSSFDPRLQEIAFRRSREAEVHGSALRLGQLGSLEMEGIVGGIEGMLRAVARAPVVRSFNDKSCQAYLADVQASASPRRHSASRSTRSITPQRPMRTRLREPGGTARTRPHQTAQSWWRAHGEPIYG